MPEFDRTGPQGKGPLTGKAFGYCRNSGRSFRKGTIRGFGRGFRNNNFFDESYKPLNKEEEKKILEEQLNEIEEEKKVIQNKLNEIYN